MPARRRLPGAASGRRTGWRGNLALLGRALGPALPREAGAGADAGAAATGAAASALATFDAGAAGALAGATAAGAEGALATLAGTCGAGAAAGGTTAPVATAAPVAALAAAAGAPEPADTGAEAVPSLFRSEMFFDSSAMRAEAALACLSFATCSSAAFCPCTAPFDSVSLSGAAVAGLRSSTWVWTLPLAERSAAATSADGAAPAKRRRKSLKSRLCAAMIWRASPGGVARAWVSSGNCSTAPDFSRFTLPRMKASGLDRIIATSIWSSDTPAGRLAAARRPAVSPA